jgi:hypothetical protein
MEFWLCELGGPNLQARITAGELVRIEDAVGSGRTRSSGGRPGCGSEHRHLLNPVAIPAADLIPNRRTGKVSLIFWTSINT